MSNDATPWHSDDELASALERALEIPAEDASVTPPAPDFSDLFAALSEQPDSVVPAATESVVELADEPSAEKVFETLDDFKPRTNFIPIQSETQTHAVPVTSAQVTQPIKWDRQRPTFDEIVFGLSRDDEN